jgi:hypothetical protein
MVVQTLLRLFSLSERHLNGGYIYLAGSSSYIELVGKEVNAGDQMKLKIDIP